MSEWTREEEERDLLRPEPIRVEVWTQLLHAVDVKGGDLYRTSKTDLFCSTFTFLIL
jgi:hypothetical protein